MSAPIRVRERRVDSASEARLVAAGVAPLLARVYAARGIESASQIEASLDRLLEPRTLTDVERAAALLADAIARNAPLLVIADYDCDGATACAVAVRGLRLLGATVDYLVPNRFETGYGLTPEIVEIAHQRFAPAMIITVDNGIASVAGGQRAAELGIELIITDHHLPGPVLPRAAAIVNPNQHGCGFASKNLAGVGVMFYVLLALRAELRRRGRFAAGAQPRLDGLLDLVALGTVADVVRLDGNNRILVAEGLKRMRAGRLAPGLAALFGVAQRSYRSASVGDLGFSIAPRINAAGRLADMSLGIACLVSDDRGEAEAMAQRLSAINDERRQIEADMLESARQALARLPQQQALAHQAAICVFDAGWHQGVVGIVAGRLKDQFHRPTIALAPIDGARWRGSGRSIEGVHLRDALDLIAKREPELILQFGGHAMAAGVTIAAAALPRFMAAFEATIASLLAPAMKERVIEVDGSLGAHALSVALVAELEAGVWGQGFAAPVFCDEFDILSQRTLKERHTRLDLRLADARSLEGIWFNHAEPLPARARLVYRLATDSYNGISRIQAVVLHQVPDQHGHRV